MLWQRPGMAVECRQDDSTYSSDWCVDAWRHLDPDKGFPDTYLGQERPAQALTTNGR